MATKIEEALTISEVGLLYRCAVYVQNWEFAEKMELLSGDAEKKKTEGEVPFLDYSVLEAVRNNDYELAIFHATHLQ